jgi:hypothetical protein
MTGSMAGFGRRPGFGGVLAMALVMAANDGATAAAAGSAAAAPAAAPDAPAASAQQVAAVGGQGLSADQVKALIQDATKGFVSVDDLNQRLALIKLDDLKQELADLRDSFGKAIDLLKKAQDDLSAKVEAPAPLQARTMPQLTVATAEKLPIDKKYLKGMQYRTSRPRKGSADEGDATIHEPVIRDLTPEDVLDWADRGDKVVFVTGDGQTYEVAK